VRRGAFFDAGGILYDRESSSDDYLRRLLRERGYPASLSSELESRRLALHRDASLGNIAPRGYWNSVLAMYGVPDADRAALEDLLDVFADAVVPDPEAREVLGELERRGFAVGVITDTIFPLERKMRWLRAAGVTDLLDVVSCSSALGVKKPDAAIYRDALARTSVEAKDAVFVGHSAEELAGARAVGMTTIALHGDRGATADRAVERLSDLLRLDVLAISSS